MRIELFKAEDLKKVDSIEIGVIDAEDFAKQCEDAKCAFTGWDEDKIIGCAGVINRGDRIGEVWASFSKNLPRYKFEAWRMIKEGLGIIIMDDNYDKFITHCRTGFEKGERILRHLGFRETFKTTCTLDGCDCYMYEKIL